ncbi:MAG: histidine triad nucleotide-binding protein [Deltaproteobacteria bacterium]|nr:histidine triad nucleotide-binding protein [Deltaproteobacteria bacterium]
MSDCLFCRIRDGQVPATMVHQDEHCIAFRDIHPQAPTHILVVPRKHIATLNDATEEDALLLGHVLLTAKKIARDEGHGDPGWRAIANVNRDAGQTVFHLHVHVLGGRRLGPLG